MVQLFDLVSQRKTVKAKRLVPRLKGLVILHRGSLKRLANMAAQIDGAAIPIHSQSDTSAQTLQIQNVRAQHGARQTRR